MRTRPLSNFTTCNAYKILIRNSGIPGFTICLTNVHYHLHLLTQNWWHACWLMKMIDHKQVLHSWPLLKESSHLVCPTELAQPASLWSAILPLSWWVHSARYVGNHYVLYTIISNTITHNPGTWNSPFPHDVLSYGQETTQYSINMTGRDTHSSIPVESAPLIMCWE